MIRTKRFRAWVAGLALACCIATACSSAAPAAPTAAPAAQPTVAGGGAAAATNVSASTSVPAAQPTATLASAVAPTAGASAEGAPTVAPLGTPGLPTTDEHPEVAGALQEIRIAITEPPNLDPGITGDSQSIEIIQHVFEGLVAQDRDGQIVPRVAERWDVSADGLTYTFHLRDGPTWSDGKPLRAADFEWAWKRNIDPASASSYATSLFPIKNAEKISRGELDRDQLGVNARDDHTLVVTVEQPAAYLLVLASTWTLMPLRQDVIETHGNAWVEAEHIVSNGPYRLVEWAHDQQIVLERNEQYWGRKPQIQRAIYRIFPDDGDQTALAAYESGELDTLGTTMTIPTADSERVKNDPALGYMEFESSGSGFIVVNHRREYLSDPRVRQALGMTIDRDALLSIALNGVATPAYTLQPPGIVGRNPDVWPREDVAAAQKLLAEAGYPNGEGMPELSYVYGTSNISKLIAEYLQQRWKETLGIDLALTNLEWAAFLDWRITSGWTETGDLFNGNWFSDYEDPYNYYNLLWDSRSDSDQYNTGWKNDRYDQLVRQAAGETDSARREALYAQAEQILAADYPLIPLNHNAGRTLARPYVKGLQPSRAGGFLPLETMSIEPH